MDSPSQDECRPGPDLIDDTVGHEPRYVPFIWQSGSRLLLMDRTAYGWAIAEFAFNPRLGVYESRREGTYDSPREASGVLMATLITADPAIQGSLAECLIDWVGEHATVVQADTA